MGLIITHVADQWAGRSMVGRAAGLAERWLGRSFPSNVTSRVLIYYTGNAISWSQVYPFVHYAKTFEVRYQCALRFLPVSNFLEEQSGPDADVILIQPWFTTPATTVAQALERLSLRLPKAKISFLDSFAHNDLRLGQAVAPYVRHYLKKSLFKDRHQYLRAFRGDTNLTEYYSELYGIEPNAPVDWGAPEALLHKLHLSPNFFTAPRFITRFESESLPPPWEGREIDIQSRLGIRGTPWYMAMREQAQHRIKAISGLYLAPPGKLSLKAFMTELANARLCFSPFGYGELCWRDVEAFQAGSVLIKPDMGHLDTLPSLYEPGVTYLPVRWDFSDLEEVVRGALADQVRSAQIAREAHRRITSYIRSEQFVEDMGFLFE